MPGATHKAKAEKKGPKFQIPFTRKNYMAFGVGLGLLLVGYICLAQPPQDGFLSLTLAPILMVLAYCVVFPYAIMAKGELVVADQAPATRMNRMQNLAMSGGALLAAGGLASAWGFWYQSHHYKMEAILTQNSTNEIAGIAAILGLAVALVGLVLLVVGMALSKGD